MKTKTTILLLGILMISGALAYYPGETIIVPNEMGMENLVYTIIGNSTPIGELNVSINSTNITIEFPGDMNPDNFQIVFIEEQTKEVVQTIYRGGGGGTRTKYVDRNITVYEPEYINTTEIIEVDKPIDNTIILKTGYELWMIFLAMAVGGFFIYIIMKKKKEDTAEEIVNNS